MSRWLPIGALVSGCLALLAGPPEISLEEAASRRPPSYSPVYENRTVAVRGRVSTPAIRLLDYMHIGIQDDRYGLVLEASNGILDGLVPGDDIRVEGVISKRGGLPVLVPSSIRLLSRYPAPLPVELTPTQVRGFRYLGLLVSVEGPVIGMGDNAGGSYLLVGRRQHPLKVFLPAATAGARRGFEGIAVGDVVRATGVASQYCPLPPHDSMFQLLVRSSGDVIRTSRAWLVEPWQAGGAVIAVLAMLVLWWMYERRARARSSLLRSIYALGEEVLSVNAAPEILKRISAVIPKAFGITRVRLYSFNRASKTLDRVPASEDEAPGSILIDAPTGVVESAAVACFRNRTLLAIPDTRRSPYAREDWDGAANVPKSLLLVPLFAQGDVEGVLELADDSHAREFSSTDQAVVQHLANQIGLALKLFEQRSIREQLSRSEKLAALGQLISGVVNELRAPLASIAARAESALADGRCEPLTVELQAIASEAGRASDIVSRLISFARSDRIEAKPIDVQELLRTLMEFREREWKARGIQLNRRLSGGSLMVNGSRGQLEQVLLNLIVHAEQALVELPEKAITITGKALGGRVLVEIGYNTGPGPESGDPLAGAASGLAVCRSIITGHGGELRFERTSGGAVFIVELPARAYLRRTGAAPGPNRTGKDLTVLSIEPDEAVQRNLLEMLSARGMRVVPVRSPAEGLDLVQRLRFDLVFCSVSMPGFDYVELFRRIHDRAGAVVLVSESRPPETFEGAFTLPKPFEAEHLERVLEAIERRAANAPAGR